jgi:probable O-glycosylation ligase (exosortase A-associated)
MPLRDIFVLGVIFASIPYILKRPWFGILMWSWLAYMNPHKISWGFARDFPVAMVIGIVTIIALLFSREPKKIPWTRETIVLVIFVSWMTLTTLTTLSALKPEFASVQLEKVLKIQLMTFVTLILINSPYRVNALAWTIGLSLGFYGVKGGIFTITSGGGQHVMGPAGTFIGGNNEIGLALIMTIPLLRYMQLNAKRRWVRWGMTAAIALCLIAILGTQSRGAFLGLGAMLLFLVLKSRRRIPFLVFAAIAIPIYRSH